MKNSKSRISLTSRQSGISISNLFNSDGREVSGGGGVGSGSGIEWSSFGQNQPYSYIVTF